MLEFDDIQHILLTRTPAITGRYEFLSFDTPAGGRAWLTELLDKVQSAADVQATVDRSDRWVTLAFTWNGLRALGVPEESLATFPDEFREGMAARADILGDIGAAAPERWVGGLAGEDLHAIAILFSRTDEQCRRSIAEHDKLLARTDGVRSLSFLDLNATPPFNYAHDHFGFRDRLSQPVMKGSGEEPTPGSGAPLEPGEFILGYPDEDGPVANLPEPEVLSRNGSYMAYRRLQEHVGAFRDYLRGGDEAGVPGVEALLQPLQPLPGGGDVEMPAAHRHRGPVRVRPGELAHPAHQLQPVLPLHHPDLPRLRLVEPGVEGALVAEVEVEGHRGVVEEPHLPVGVVQRGQQRGSLH